MMTSIELAALERLRLAGTSGALGYVFRTLESYPEQFDKYLVEKMRGRCFPAAWIVFGGWRPPIEVGGVIRVPATFMVVVAAENLRNETAQRHGAGEDEVGSYQLALDAAGLLHGQSLGLEIDALQLGPCRSVRPPQAIEERKVSLYALEFTTAFDVAGVTFGQRPIGDFSTFSVDWDVPPFGGVDGDAGTPGVQLPAAEAADASDVVEMPQ
jgi:phage gp37-like protein